MVYVQIEEMNLAIINLYRPLSSDIHSFMDIINHIREWTSETTRGWSSSGILASPTNIIGPRETRKDLEKQSKAGTKVCGAEN